MADKTAAFAVRMSEQRNFALHLFLLGFLARILFTLIHPKMYLIADMAGYNEAAISLLQDHEFRVKGVISASRPPVYPYFLLVIYSIFGHSLFAVRIVQAAVGAFTSVVVFKTGELMFDRKTGALAGVMWALYTASWALGDMILSESLFALLMITSVYFIIRIAEFGSPWIILWAAVFAGAATLTRTIYTPFVPFLLLVIMVLKIGNPRLISRYILLLLIFLMTLFPWMLRNYYTHGVFTMNPKSGVDFYLYNHSGVSYIINNYADTKFFYDNDVYTWSEVKKGRIFKEMGVEWIKKNPHLFIFKGCRMMLNIWGFDRDYLWWYIAGAYSRDPTWLFGMLALLTNMPFLIIAPLAFAGFFISRPLRGNLLVPTTVLVCFHLLAFAVFAFSRHRFPFITIVIVWAAYAILNWNEVRKTLGKGAKSWRKTAIILSWVFLLFAWGTEFALDAGSLFGMRFEYPGF